MQKTDFVAIAAITKTMKIKKDSLKEYTEYKKVNCDDPYSREIVLFGERWMCAMETKIANGAGISDSLAPSAREADIDGITGFMYSCAAQAIAYFWEHGEEFRRAYNLKEQIHEEGGEANNNGGILNKAVINIS